MLRRTPPPLPKLFRPEAGAMSNEALLPLDAHNAELQKNVHPTDWVNPAPNGRYNLVVVGAGTAGLVAAAGAAGLGARVALIERNLMGGDCLNVGCVPSKAVISSARAAAAVRRAGDFGVRVASEPHIDFTAVMERMRRLRSEISPNDSASRFKGLGVDVYFGQARFVGGDAVEVGGSRLRYSKAVIATGARAAAPPIPGLESVPYLTNETLFSLTEAPARIAIVGAGPIGCEMAQSFAQLGSEVFLIETSHGVLPREDRDAAAVVERALVRDGVHLLCCGKEIRVHADGAGVVVTLSSHGKGYNEKVDRLLIAAGRKANVEGLCLESVSVEYDEKGVRVDDHLRTTNRRIYAAGDVCSRYQFTHAADFMARLVIQNALFKGRKKASALTIPWCTYTSPEVAHVGLYRHEAEERGIEFDVYKQSFEEVDRAILEGETEGFVLVTTKKGTDKLLGATVVAPNAGDIIAELTLAMTHGLGLSKIGSTIHPYPTQAEAVRKLGDQFNRTKLTPLVKKLFKHWLSWTR